MRTVLQILDRLIVGFELSQRDIASQAKIPEPTLSKWKKKPPRGADDALRLAELLAKMEKKA